MPLQSKHYDVVVIGAALVGASAVVGLAKQGFKVALIDIKAPSFASADPEVWDSRIYAISPGNVDWLGQIGVWEHVNQARLTAIAGMHVWADANSPHLSFDAADAHLENLGVILENSCLHQALWDELKSLDVDVMLDVQCADIDFGLQAVTIRMMNGTSLFAQLLVAADGGNSWVRSQAALGVQKMVLWLILKLNYHIKMLRDNGLLKMESWLGCHCREIVFLWFGQQKMLNI
ncbi:MAG: hypothetical protein RLZZ351_134 [Pseudomonadota bacterium]